MKTGGFWAFSVIIVLFAISGCDSSSSSLSSDPGGYDGLHWGASMEAVKSKYPEVKLIREGSLGGPTVQLTDLSSLGDGGDKSSSMSREFGFYEDKLKVVYVSIYGVKQDLVVKQLEKKYGKFHHEVEYLIANVWGFDWEFDTTHIYTHNFGNNVTIVYENPQLTKQEKEQKVTDRVNATKNESDRQQKAMNKVKF